MIMAAEPVRMAATSRITLRRERKRMSISVMSVNVNMNAWTELMDREMDCEKGVLEKLKNP